MSIEVSRKLEEIVRICSQKQVRVTFTQYGSKKNSIEETIEMGEGLVIIQLGDQEDPDLPKLLNDFLEKLRV